MADRPWWTAGGLAVLLLVLYIPAGVRNGATASADLRSVAVAGWQLAHHHRLTLPRSLLSTDIWIERSRGRLVTDRMPGLLSIGAAVEFLAAAHRSALDLAPLAVAAAVVAAGAMGVLSVLLRRLVSGRVALGAAAVAGLATPTWAISSNGMWPHGPDQLLVLLALLALAAGRSLPAGVALGLAVTVRPLMAVWSLVVGCATALRARRLWPLVAFGVPAALGAALVAGYDLHVFGHLSLQAGYGTVGQHPLSKLTDWSPRRIATVADNLAGSLVSPSRGVLAISPFLILVLPGLRPAWRAAPEWVRSSALAGLAYFLLTVATERHFSGGVQFWAYRYELEPLTMAAPLLLLCWREWTARWLWCRRAFWALVVLSVGIEATGVFNPSIWELDPWALWWEPVIRQTFGVSDAAIVTLWVTLAATVLTLGVPALRDRLRPSRAATPAAEPELAVTSGR